MALYNWSTTAATNATADPSINWAEGQAPSSVNDSARAMMAAVAKYRDDTAATLISGGTSTAYTLATNQVFDTLGHLSGQELSFFPHATNGASPTLNVDGLGAYPIKTDIGTAIPAGTLIANSPYTAVFNNGSGCFQLKDFFGNPYNIPIGGGMDYWGSTVPNSNFAFPIGQAISRTTYAALFAIIGTTYGTGDGSTTFNLPDKTGRSSVMKEATATRLTTAGGGIDGGTLGAVGGVQNVTLAANQIPSLTSVNASQAISVLSSLLLVDATGGLLDFNPASAAGFRTVNNTATQRQQTSTGNNSISTTYTNSSQAVTKTVQPSIVCNYIMRII